MMKKYIFCIICLVLVTFQVSKAQSVSYSYDSSGNRTARVIIYSEVNAKNQGSIVDYMDKVLDHDITISPNPIRGQMTVKVGNLADSDKCQLHIYSRKDRDGVTLGSYININENGDPPYDKEGKFVPYMDNLYMHEYGHYLQSQSYGFKYLFSIGIPSLLDLVRNGNDEIEINGKKYKKHSLKWFEQDANRRVNRYFDGLYSSWNYVKNPLVDPRKKDPNSYKFLANNSFSRFELLQVNHFLLNLCKKSLQMNR